MRRLLQWGVLALLISPVAPSWAGKKAVLRSQAVRRQRELVLFDAVKGDNTGKVRRLLSHGVNANARTKLCQTPLHCVATIGSARMVRLLINHGAKINARTSDRMTPLHLATQCDNDGIVKELLRHGAHVNVRDRTGKTPLLNAAELGSIEVASLLCDYGADVNAVTLEGYTAVRYAAANNLPPLVELLLDLGAKPNPPQVGQEQTALHRAARSGGAEVAWLLLNRGAEVNARDECGKTPLHWAPMGGRVEVAETLLDWGARINAIDSGSKTPLAMALAEQRVDMARLLLVRGAQGLERVPFLHTEEGLIPDCAVNRFAVLARSVLHCAKMEDPRRALSVFCGGDQQKLKSDAFVHKRPWHVQPVVQSVLHAAENAACLGRGDPNEARYVFRQLIANDVARVETTRKLSWRKYLAALSQKNRHSVQLIDMVDEVAQTVVFPLLVKRNSVRTLSVNAVETLGEVAADLVARLIVRDKSTLDLEGVVASWQKVGNQLPDSLRPLDSEGRWYPLFRGTAPIGGDTSLVALVSSTQLIREGDAMAHCVGANSYARSCREGYTHIVSVRRSGKPIATVELSGSAQGDIRTSDGRRWKVKQMRGEGNTEPPPEALTAWELFVRDVKLGRIRLTGHHGEDHQSRQRTEEADPASRHAGYDLNSADRVLPQILNHYRTRVVAHRGRKGAPIPLLPFDTIDQLEMALDDLFIAPRWRE